MTTEQAAREFVKQTRDESGPAHDPHSLLVGFLAGATWERDRLLAAVDELLPKIDGPGWIRHFLAAAIRARTQAATEGRGEAL